MFDYISNTEWAHNKKSDAIVYLNADGSTTEITIEVFLADSPDNTEEMFRKLKKLSDAMLHDEDVAASERTKRELPLCDWSKEFVSETLEEQFINAVDDELYQEYLKRRKQLIELVPDVLNKLSKTQQRRFLLYKVNGMTIRKIAEIEGVTHQSVIESILGTEKKIKKILKKMSESTTKHPAKKEDL